MSHEASRLLDDATGLVQLTDEAGTDFVIQDGVGTVAHGDWAQAAATWSATGSEAFTGTASFDQAAASWDATGTVAADITGTATWDQAAATWSAAGTTAEAQPEPIPGFRGGTQLRPFIAPPERQRRYAATASFAQAPASWHAEMTHSDDELSLLLLVA